MTHIWIMNDICKLAKESNILLFVREMIAITLASVGSFRENAFNELLVRNKDQYPYTISSFSFALNMKCI